MKTLIIFFLSLFIFKSSFSITIPQAIEQKKIKITFENKGGYKGAFTEMQIQNMSGQRLEINSQPGLIIESEDTTSQRLVINDVITTVLLPNKTFTQTISTFCINSFKGAPQQGEKYHYLKESDNYLFRLINFIHQKKTNTDISQYAVWACMNGKKDLHLTKSTPDLIELKKLVFDIYGQKLAAGIINKDTTSPAITYEYFNFNGSYDFFVKENGVYSAFLEDSLGVRQNTYFENRTMEEGMYPVRYMHHYTASKEKKFYITIYKNGALLEKTPAISSPTKKYVRWSVKSNTVFNIKEPVTANLDIKDSAGNKYLNFFKARKMTSGIIPFDYSFTISKPSNTKLYLILSDANNGNLLAKQNISESKNLMPLKGYFYVRLPQTIEATFGLYNSKDELVEQFESKRYQKGLQMLPYGFIFDKDSRETFYLKLKDNKTGQDIQSEKVFVK